MDLRIGHVGSSIYNCCPLAPHEQDTSQPPFASGQAAIIEDHLYRTRVFLWYRPSNKRRGAHSSDESSSSLAAVRQYKGRNDSIVVPAYAIRNFTRTGVNTLQDADQ